MATDAKDDWLEAMARAVGSKGFTRDADTIARWLIDWRGRYTGAAAAMVSPATTNELADVVKIASAHHVPLVPQGGNSGMVGGATPDDTGRAVLVSLRRMNAVRALREDERLIVVEAGMILQNLHERAAEHGLRFPLTLGGKGSATVGGLVSTNAGGTQVLRHGTMRALVAGVEAVLPDGHVHDSLAALKKDNRGYDLKQLLIGAEGTLGFVTAATLKLVPALVDRAVAWVGVNSPRAAYELLRMVEQQEGGALEGFEIVPASCLDAVLEHIPDTRAPLPAPAPWNALIELVRDSVEDADPAARMEAVLADALDRGIVRDAAIAANEAQAEAFWKLRDSIAEAERAEGYALQHDISVPVGAMADFIGDSARAVESRFPGTRVAAFGHLGDGNVHYHVKAAREDDLPPDVSRFVYDLVVDAGGSISAEHGIGQNKRDELARTAHPGDLAALAAIKRALDPQGIMNPGKLMAARQPALANRSSRP